MAVTVIAEIVQLQWSRRVNTAECVGRVRDRREIDPLQWSRRVNTAEGGAVRPEYRALWSGFNGAAV